MRKFLVGVFVIAMAIIHADAQQPSTVTNLPFASTPFSGSELFYVVQGGVSKKATFAAFQQSSSASLVVGSSLITGGTSGDIEFNNGGVLGEKGVTGTGSVVLATSPTISSLTYGGVTLANSVTGTGSMVLSVSPTLTPQFTIADTALQSSVSGLGPRGNEFIWSNCGATIAAGQVCGLQVWVGNNPTATPAANEAEAALFEIANGNNRATVMTGVNILAGVCGPNESAGCTTGAGYLGASIDSFEVDLNTPSDYTYSNRAFNSTNAPTYYANGPEVYSQSLGPSTAAYSAWSTTQTNFWYEGLAVARIGYAGLHCNHITGDTFAEYAGGCIVDDSNSVNVLVVGGTHSGAVVSYFSLGATQPVFGGGSHTAATNWDFANAANFNQTMTIDSGLSAAQNSNYCLDDRAVLEWCLQKDVSENLNFINASNAAVIQIPQTLPSSGGTKYLCLNSSNQVTAQTAAC